MKKTAVIYWSGTGNTESMAEAVAEGLRAAGAETELLTPEQSCRESLWRRIRARAARLFLNRYAAAAAAVTLALTMLWGSAGVTLPERLPLPEDRPTVSDGLRKWNESLDSVMSGLNDFFDGLGQRPLPSQGGN